jgi:LPPG:FO 2-phospho-L-lactate transferase
VHIDGARDAAAAPAALEALTRAETIIIGPSNPVISIGPILAIDQIRDALETTSAPVIAVSPIVGGKVLKGPTEACLAWAGESTDAAGVARYYGSLIDAIVADEGVDGVHSLVCDTWMGGTTARRELAGRTLELAKQLAG